MIRLWKGCHSPELPALIGRALEHGELLVLCPPRLSDFAFLSALPAGEVECVGDWTPAQVALARRAGAPAEWQGAHPVLGVFTSGTASGRSRLILYTRENLEASLDGVRSFFETFRIRAIFCYPQPFHVFGLALGYVHALTRRLKLIAPEGPYSRGFHEAWLQAPREGLLTLGTPTHFHDLAKFVRETGASPSPSYSAIVGGAQVSVELWRALRDALAIEKPSIGYGASELSPAITHHPPGREPLEDGEVGVPIPGIEIVRRPGEGVECLGPNLCAAIVETAPGEPARVEHPRRVLIRDELEVRASDGMWAYRGRNELRLNRGGQKFSLEAIEDSVRARFGLDCVAVAMPDPRLAEELGVLVRGSGVDRSAIYAWLREQFDASFDSLRFLEVPEFPLNASAKIDRGRCAQLMERVPRGLPHRGPAVWIDEVVRAGDDEGECRVTLREDANYFGRGRVRESSVVEWIAQGFGFAQASLRAGAAPPARAYLVALKNVEWADRAAFLALRPGDQLRIRARKTHQVGPVALVEGEVLREGGTILARAQIRLFADGV